MAKEQGKTNLYLLAIVAIVAVVGVVVMVLNSGSNGLSSTSEDYSGQALMAKSSIGTSSLKPGSLFHISTVTTRAAEDVCDSCDSSQACSCGGDPYKCSCY